MRTLSAPLQRAARGSAIDRALAWSDAYRVLARAFVDPADPHVPVDRSVLELGLLQRTAERLGVRVDARTWAAARSVSRPGLRARQHRTVFGHVVAHGCPPYETEFGRGHVFGQAQQLGDIRGFYEAFGVRPRHAGERPDHVACELEFLSLLTLKEAIALARDEDDGAAICRSAAGGFVADHIGRWLPALAGLIARRAPDSGFAALATIGARFVAVHAVELGATPTVLQPDDLLPVTEAPDGMSFECGVDVEAGDLAPPGA